jgi:hypothetical protein
MSCSHCGVGYTVSAFVIDCNQSIKHSNIIKMYMVKVKCMLVWNTYTQIPQFKMATFNYGKDFSRYLHVNQRSYEFIAGRFLKKLYYIVIRWWSSRMLLRIGFQVFMAVNSNGAHLFWVFAACTRHERGQKSRRVLLHVLLKWWHLSTSFMASHTHSQCEWLLPSNVYVMRSLFHSSYMFRHYYLTIFREPTP